MNSGRLPMLFVVALLVAAMIVLLVVTRYGVGLSPDSITYIGGARGILAGDGFSLPPENLPVTHVAPCYSLLLAAWGLIGLDPVESARWVAAGLLGVNLALIYLLVVRIRGQFGSVSRWTGLAMVLVAVVSRPLWEIHLMAWTEPAFIAMSLAGIGLTAGFLTEFRSRQLMGAGAMIGLAIVTRYAGLSMWVALCLVLLLFGKRSLLQRVRDILFFSVFSLTPFILWTLRNSLLSGTATNRSLAYHPINRSQLQEALLTMSSWMAVSENAGGWIKLGTLLLAGVLFIGTLYLWARKHPARTLGTISRALPVVVKVALVSAVVYFLFLIVSISFVDGNTPLDQRILAPLFAFLLIPAAFGLHLWFGLVGSGRRGRVALWLLLCVGCLFLCRTTWPVLSHAYAEGVGFNNKRWRESELIRDLKKMQPAGTVYSNSPGAVYYHTGRGAKRIPVPFSKVTQSRNSSYEEELATFKKSLEEGGLLVFFDLGSEPLPGGVSNAIRTSGTIESCTYKDGVIYLAAK